MNFIKNRKQHYQEVMKLKHHTCLSKSPLIIQLIQLEHNNNLNTKLLLQMNQNWLIRLVIMMLNSHNF